MEDSEFLNWMADRIVNVYKESRQVDFVQKLYEISDSIRKKDFQIAMLKDEIERYKVGINDLWWSTIVKK